MFRFAFQSMLIGYLLVPLLALFLWWAWRRKKQVLQTFAGSRLAPKLAQMVNRRAPLYKALLLVVALTLLITALARPQFGTRLETVRREGLDIIIALDVSESMLAEDIAPNRLEKAKHAVSSLIRRLDGDRIGLVAFAGEAFVQCPLTLDYGAAQMFLRSMDTQLLSVPGTNLGKAVELSLKAFQSGEMKHKVLILITDGEDHQGQPLEKAEEASDQGVTIFTVGIGSPQGVPIPEFDQRGRRVGFKKNQQGEVVTTALDEASLERIAETAQGRYFRATPGEDELAELAGEIESMEKRELDSQQFRRYEEQFQLFLGAALLLLLGEFFVPERRKPSRIWKGRFQ
ncbi:MAG TPA: VWA domain-containing protein [Acidobacteriota bacterium]|nr:VWA domain-containing protein [Acidobacteriota bacterium]